MLDRNPITMWAYGRIALLRDAARPPLQSMAQRAIMAIEDGWVLAHNVSRRKTATPDGPGADWDVVLAPYEAVRAEHCRRVGCRAGPDACSYSLW